MNLRSMTVLTDKSEISFSEDDRIDVQDLNHDGLLITLHIANMLVRRILIDGGSSANMILLDTLKRMKIPESDIVPKSSALIGFSGEVKHTVGDVRLPIYMEGINTVQKFCIIDIVSSYNVILGRPWIHGLKAVASTYHQCVNIPSPWGIIKITSDQQGAKDCYATDLKPSKILQEA